MSRLKEWWDDHVKYKYHYFISYSYNKGFGRINTSFSKEINHYNFESTYKIIRKTVMKNFPEVTGKEIVILNIQRLK
jgi:hypothetical protein